MGSALSIVIMTRMVGWYTAPSYSSRKGLAIIACYRRYLKRMQENKLLI